MRVTQADSTEKVELRSGDPTAAGGGGSLHFPSPGESTDNAVQISTTLAGDVELRINNLDAGVGNGMRVVVDGQIRKNTAKTGIPLPPLQHNTGSVEDLEVENVGVGTLNLRLVDGDLLLDVGDITLTAGDVAAQTFTGPSSLWSASAAGIVDAAEFTAPLITIDPAASSLGYAYDSRVEFEVDYHPVMGGWEPLAPGTVRIDYQTATSPPYIRPSTTGANLVIRIPLTVPNWYRSSPATTSDMIRIVSVEIRYRRSSVSDTMTLRLIRLRKDGTSTEDVVTTLAAAVSVTDTTDDTGTLNHVINRGTFTYFLEATMFANTIPSDTRLMNVLVTYDKFGIE